MNPMTIGDEKVVATVVQNHCDCHPETCCCSDFEMRSGDVGMAYGSYESMIALADLINGKQFAYAHIQAELVSVVEDRDGLQVRYDNVNSQRLNVWNENDDLHQKLQAAESQLAELRGSLTEIATEIGMYDGVSPRKWQIRDWAEQLRKLAAADGGGQGG